MTWSGYGDEDCAHHTEAGCQIKGCSRTSPGLSPREEFSHLQEAPIIAAQTKLKPRVQARLQLPGLEPEIPLPWENRSQLWAVLGVLQP